MRLLAMAAVAAAGLAGTAIAQSSSASDVCKGMPTPAEEIACLRGALEESRSTLSRERGSAGAPAVAPAPVAPPAAPEVVQQRQQPAAPAPVRRPEQLGDEQVASVRRETKQPEAEPERIQAVAAAVATDPRGYVTFQLDNGQLWRQSEKPDIPLQLRDNRKYAVEIRRSGFGGYRLKFTEMGRQVAVRRVQ